MTINPTDMSNSEENIEIIDLDSMNDIFNDSEQPVIEEGIDNEL